MTLFKRFNFPWSKKKINLPIQDNDIKNKDVVDAEHLSSIDSKSEINYTEDIYKYLLQHKSITASICREVFSYDRLAAVIYKLKLKGHNITSEIKEKEIQNGRKIQYRLYTLHK